MRYVLRWIAIMQRSPKLMQYAARIMLFSRQNCSLCESAKKALNNVGKIRGFEYHEVDVMAAGNEQWKAAYEFDAPVVRKGFCELNFNTL